MEIISFFLINLFSGIVVVNLRYDETAIRIEERDGLKKVLIEGLELTGLPGAPQLPVEQVKIAIPFGAKVKEIKSEVLSFKEITGEYSLFWAQPPVILSKEGPFKQVKRNDEIYLSERIYPEEIIQLRGEGVYDNQKFCEVLVFPLQYIPKQKRLILNTEIVISVEYEGGFNSPANRPTTRGLVKNPEDIVFKSNGREDDFFKYLIISPPQFDTVFQRLANWKTKKGIKAEVRTTGWIISNYPGEDSAAKIRNYLKTLPDSGVDYVLFGGDVNFIPCRFAYAMDCSAGFLPGREDTMPCDLYYADLQGNWDLDGDHSYGEIEDSIDLYPDLFVGRAPVGSVAQAQRFVDKVLTYEKSPPPEYLDNGLFAAEILWFEPYTDQGVHKNKIEEESFPPNFQLTKLYQSLGNETREAVMQAIRDGQGLINHDGHGWIDLISVGGWPHRIYCADFDTITNAPRYGILYSIGCWTGAFDFASIAEAFVNSPNGGGVAYIGNSSYGWGSPGNPGFGYSDRFDSRFFYSLFKEDNFHLGEALSLAKAHFIPYSREKNVYRWHQYQINLLGDPELSVWTKSPQGLNVSYPQSIPLGNAQILITVRDAQTNIPLKNARVCLMKGPESYSSGLTDASGTVFLLITPSSSGNFDLTVTAHNYLPFETTIPVISGPYVNFFGWIINDLFGNNDHIPNPQEGILLPTKIKNCGNETANNIQLRLRAISGGVIIPDSTASVDYLPPQDSIVIDNAFAIQIDSLQNGDCLRFELEITHDNQSICFNPVMLVGTPQIAINLIKIVSPPSLPAEVESLNISIKNSGFGIGHSCRGELVSLDPYVFTLIDSVRFGDVMPESTMEAVTPFVVYISPFSPPSYLARLFLQISSENYLFCDTFDLLIGETGFSDDMESGTMLWTSGGTNNLWHLSQRRSYSPTHSWYCGDEGTGNYIDSMDCYIQTIPFMIKENSILSFYRWFSVPIYGSDGMYVIIIHDGVADTLDFIGTGGALGGKGIQSEWFEQKYCLTGYPSGETIQVRFSFISDGDGAVGEGFYIDDVNVEYDALIKETIGNPMPYVLRLNVYPNPFRNHLVIHYALWTKHNGPDKIVPTISIYDATGRLVKDFSRLTFNVERSTILWDGSDDLGRKLPAGVYFVRLEAGDYKQIEKAVLLR